MPSRRSDRGGALRRQLERAEAAEPELNAAIEERRRWENERDLAFREGWEEWDSLDWDTRQDLIRESLVVGGLGSVASAVTSPRSLGVKQGTKAILSKAAPELAKRLYAAQPRRAVKGLIERIKDVRRNRDPSKPTPWWKKDESGPLMRHPNDSRVLPRTDKLTKEQVNRMAEWAKSQPNTELQKDALWVAQTAIGATSAGFANVRDAYYHSGGKGDLIYDLKDMLFSEGEYSQTDNERKAAVEDQRRRREAEKENIRYMKEQRRKDNMYTATDEEWDAAFRRKAKEDASHN